MLILLDCRPLQEMGPDSEKSRFIISCANILSGEQGVEWLFLVDGASPADWLSGPSKHRVLTRRIFPGKAGWKIWYDWQIPLAARRYKPDLVMTTGNLAAAARMRIPQCVWMTERGKDNQPAKKTITGAYGKRLAAALQSAQVIFSFSGKDKEWFIRHVSDPTAAGKILVVSPAADQILPPSPGQKENVQERYAEGKEYFLTPISGATPAEVVDLLKAFSLFKKRQRSNMQLVLTGGNPLLNKDLASRLATYKYRQDIHWTPHLTEKEWGPLAGASYAIVAPFEREEMGGVIVNAWKAGVPVITTTAGAASLPDITGAGLFATPGDPASLAGQLMLIYKDEGLRSSLIGKGTIEGRAYSWERSAGEVWAGIRQAVKGVTAKSSKSVINT